MAAVFSNRFPLILASGSPRRRKFMDQLGLEFSVVSADVPEDPYTGETPQALARRLAMAKASAVAEKNTDCAVVGADTVVAHGARILGKPADMAEAEAMICALSGGWHEVWSSYAIILPKGGERFCEAVCTKVKFAELAEDICLAYALSGDGMDKAGGYGIQSGGAFLVTEIIGSYSNVIGLPMAQLSRQLLRLGVIAPT